MQRYSWSRLTDWDLGLYSSTQASNPKSAISLGYPQSKFGTEKFLYWLNEGQGDVLHSDTPNYLDAQISGNYSWATTEDGRTFLTLEGGHVSIPASPDLVTDAWVLAGMFTFNEYPSSDLLIMGHTGDYTGGVALYLTPEGKLRLGSESIDAKVPLGVPVYIAVGQTPYHSVYARVVNLAGQTVWAGRWPPTGPSFPTPNFPQAELQVGPGRFSLHFLVFLGSFVEAALSWPVKGNWQSQVVDFGEERRLAAVLVRGHISETRPVELTVVMSPERDLAKGQAARLRVTKPKAYRLPFLLSGRFAQVTLSLSGEALASPVVRSLTLVLGKSPLIIPVAEPVVYPPQSRIRVTALPPSEGVELSALGKASELGALELEAAEGLAKAKYKDREFVVRLSPQRGRPEKDATPTRAFLYPHLATPPYWLLGHHKLPVPLRGPLLQSEDGVLVGTSEWAAHAWLVSGRTLWSRSFPDRTAVPGLIHADTYYHVTYSRLYALGLRCGAIKGSVALPAAPSGPLRRLGGQLVLPLSDGTVARFSLDLSPLEAWDTGQGQGRHADAEHTDVPHHDSPHADRPGATSPHSDFYEDYNVYHRYTRYIDYTETVFGLSRRAWANEDQWQRINIHGDAPHADQPHQDQGHLDSEHEDMPHLDFEVEPGGPHTDISHVDYWEERPSAGVLELEECLSPEVVLQFPAYLAVYSADEGRVIAVIQGQARPTCFAANDELAKDFSDLRLVCAGFADGTLGLYALESGDELARRALPSTPRFVIPCKAGDTVGYLVGCDRDLLLLSGDLEVVWRRELPGRPAGEPAVSDHILLPLEDSLLVLDFLGEVQCSLKLPGRATGPAHLGKPGTVYIPGQDGLYVLGSYTRAPLSVLRVYPEKPHTFETVHIWDESLEYAGDIASVFILVQGQAFERRRLSTRFSLPGGVEIRSVVHSKLGQRADSKMVVEVLPSLTEHLPRRLRLSACAPRRLTILRGEEADLRVFWPEEGLDQVYKDEHVLLEFTVVSEFGTLQSAEFLVRAKEDPQSELLLQKSAEILDPEGGRGQVLLTPGDWEGLPPGTYYWGLYATFSSGRTDLVGRSRFELRPALR